MKRFKNAEICISGASNTRRVARALIEAIDEAFAEGAGDDTIKGDAAVVLILDQLMNLLDAYSGTKPKRFAMAYTILMEKVEAARGA